MCPRFGKSVRLTPVLLCDMLRLRCAAYSGFTVRHAPAYAFWKFLYRNKIIEYPPVSLDDLDIVIKKSKNATVPMNSLKFLELRKELKGELLSMFN